MFEAMIGHIEDDFVRYVFHLKVVQEEAPKPAPAQKLTYSAPEGPVQGAAAMRSAAVAEAAAGGEVDQGTVAAAQQAAVAQKPVQVEKVQGRNEPCACGSGKKYKFCHGR
jgi:preprotein translocase subunit SecA